MKIEIHSSEKRQHPVFSKPHHFFFFFETLVYDSPSILSQNQHQIPIKHYGFIIGPLMLQVS